MTSAAHRIFPSLTAQQLKLLQFIDSYQREHGVVPSYENMREAMDLHSKSGIARLVDGLEERGAIMKPARGLHRSITVLVEVPKGETYSKLQQIAADRGLTFHALSSKILAALERKPDLVGHLIDNF